MYWTIITLIFLTLFTPIVLPINSLFFPFITGKGFFFRILVEVAVALYGSLILFVPEYRPKATPVAYALATFIGLITVSDLFGANPLRSIWSNFERMEGLVLFYHFLAYFILISTLFSERIWNRFLATSVGVSLLVCMYSIVQLAGKLGINQGGVRVDATFGNATYLAVYLLFHIFLTIIWIWRERAESSISNIWIAILGSHVSILLYGIWLSLGISITAQQYPKAGPFTALVFLFSLLIHAGIYFFGRAKQSAVRVFFLVESLVLMMYVLFNTATRGAIIGTIVGACIAALAIAWKSEKQWVRMSAWGMCVAVVGLVLVFFLARDTQFVRNNPVLTRFAEISLHEPTTESRFVLWGMAIEGWKERPLFGWGQENFNLVFNKYFDPVLYRQEQWFDRAHSVFFDWLVSGGLFGLISYLGLFVIASYALWKSSMLSFVERAMLFGLLVAYFIQNLTVFDNLVSGMYFIVVLAFIHFHVVVEKRAKGEIRADVRPVEISATLRDGALVLVGIGFVVVVYFVDAKPLLANMNIIQALRGHQEGISKNIEYFKNALSYDTTQSNQEAREQLLDIAARAINIPTLDVTSKETVVKLALDEMAKQVQASPLDARPALFFGDLSMLAGDLDGAIASLEKARTLSPKKQYLLFELGRAYFAKKDYAKALEVMKYAYDLAPEFSEAQKWYSIALVYAGREKEGLELYHASFGNDKPLDEQFINAYAATGNYTRLVELWGARVQKNPTDPQSHLSLGLSYYGAGRADLAVAEMQKAETLNPAIKAEVDVLIAKIQAGKSPF